ncbi:unnamed protein product, partial [Iphiclides podalirius]
MILESTYKSVIWLDLRVDVRQAAGHKNNVGAT